MVNLGSHQDETLELVVTTGDTIRNILPDLPEIGSETEGYATTELIVTPGDEIEIVPKSVKLYIQVL